MPRRRLFRPESQAARANSWLGRVILIRPLSFTLLTFAALAIAAALAAFFWFGEYTRKSRVSGVLAPAHGILRVVAPQPGLVLAAYVREGDAVARDTPLFVIADARANRATKDASSVLAVRAEARRQALQRQRDHVHAALGSEQRALAERRTGLARELELVEGDVSMQAARLAIASHGADRARRLEAIGFLSPSAREREEEASLEHASRVESARRTHLSLAREIGALEFEIATARSRTQAQLAAIDLQAASLEHENDERDLQLHATLVSPISGVMGAILVEPGQMVAAGTVLATIVPADAMLEAHLFTPSRSIGFVRVGQAVLLRFLAYPHQKFGSVRARVAAISRNPLPPAELGFAPADGGREPLYRIKAALEAQTIDAYGRPEPLQPGMQLEADVQLDRRRLIEWVFEPLLSLAGRA